MVTFTSSSTVRNFLTMVEAKDSEELRTLFDGVKIAAIGPITAKTVTDNGLKVDVQPEEYTINALTRAIVDSFKETNTPK